MLQDRRAAFGMAAAVIALASAAVVSIPQATLRVYERDRGLAESQAAWAFRLLLLAAVIQAVYGGATLGRAAGGATPGTASGMVLLTIVYGIAAVAMTGERAIFWVWVGVAIVQGGWYYRMVGETTPGGDKGSTPSDAVVQWEPAGPDYCPPLARGLETPQS